LHCRSENYKYKHTGTASYLGIAARNLHEYISSYTMLELCRFLAVPCTVSKYWTWMPF